MKLARLKMLNAEASNFRFTRSVNLKTLASVMSAYHCPGPANWLRPRSPVQPRHGDERVGRPDCSGPEQPPASEKPPEHQPFAHVLREKLPNCGMVLSGRSFLVALRLKSPPVLEQFAATNGT